MIKLAADIWIVIIEWHCQIFNKSFIWVKTNRCYTWLNVKYTFKSTLNKWNSRKENHKTKIRKLSICPSVCLWDQLWTNSNSKSLNLAKFSFFGGRWGIFWTNSNSKSLNLAKFSFFCGRWGIFWTKSNLKSQHLSQFSFLGEVRGTLDTTFLKYLRGGTLRILNHKFSQPSLPLHHR